MSEKRMKPRTVTVIEVVAEVQAPTMSEADFIRLWARLIRAGELIGQDETGEQLSNAIDSQFDERKAS